MFISVCPNIPNTVPSLGSWETAGENLEKTLQASVNLKNWKPWKPKIKWRILPESILSTSQVCSHRMKFTRKTGQARLETPRSCRLTQYVRATKHVPLPGLYVKQVDKSKEITSNNQRHPVGSEHLRQNLWSRSPDTSACSPWGQDRTKKAITHCWYTLLLDMLLAI